MTLVPIEGARETVVAHGAVLTDPLGREFALEPLLFALAGVGRVEQGALATATGTQLGPRCR